MDNDRSQDRLSISWMGIITALEDPALVLDLQDRIVEMNPVAGEVIQLSGRPCKNTPITDYFPEWKAKFSRKSIDETHRADIIPDNGQELNVYEAVVSPIKGEGGEIVGKLVIFKDVGLSRKTAADLVQFQKNYKLFEDHSADLFAICDAEANFVYLSPSYESVLGVKCSEMVGKPIFELVHPDDMALVLEKMAEGYSELPTEPVMLRYRMIHGDGHELWFETLGRILFEDDGSPGGAVFSTRDITERVKVERALWESEKKYRELIENISQGVFRIDTNGLMTYVSPAVTHILGYTEDQLLGRHFAEIVHPEDLERLEQEYESALKGQGFPSEYRVRHASGNYRWIRSNSSLWVSDEGVVGIQGIFDDITERRKSEKILKESEERFASIFKYMPGAISLARVSDLRYLDVNQGFTQVYGWERDEAIGKTGLELGLWLDPAQFHLRDQQLKINGVVTDFEINYLGKNGKTGTVINQASFVEIGGQPHLLSISLEITDRKKAEEEAVKLVTAIEHSAEKISIFDSEGHFVYVNPTFERLTGYRKEEVIGRHPIFLKSENQEKYQNRDLWNTVSSGRIWVGKLINRQKDGSDIELESTVSPIFDQNGNIAGFVAVERDVTEKKKLEAQLRQSQKMEAIGTMAGGIAHDFNNLLTVILGYTQMAMKQAPEDSRIRSMLESLFGAGKRATDLVQQILAFSRISDRKREQVDFRLVIAETKNLIRSMVPALIEIRYDIQDETVHVMADPTELHQIILNLAINAYHAIGDVPGVITIASELVDIKPLDTFHQGNLEPGRYVLLRVNDTGKGIEREIIDKIFDPYFTTKKAAQGTGLGLSVVHGIVTGYGGIIRVYSEKESGTSFNVYLPVITPEEEEREAADESLPGGSERVLLVDDEDIILELMYEMLRDLGYEVESFSDGMAAFEAFQEEPDRYDVVISDQTMPHMTGMTLAEKILGERPDIPVILCTGFSAAITPEKMQELGIKGCLMKPILIEKLSQCIRNALDGISEIISS